MRKPFIAGNWKMYKTIPEALKFAKEFKETVKGSKAVDILLCVPFTILSSLSKELEKSNIMLGAQNMYFEKEGAFTGEISPVQLIDAGAKYVILGHSERRHVFGEKDDLINNKVHSALQNNLLPILCVGELIEERQSGKTEYVVKTQVNEGLKGVTKDDVLKITIAYEPVWAIGTGKTATAEDADNVHSYIRKIISDIYNKEISENLRIQYGGSVKAENIDSLMKKDNIDGALVGGASLKVDSFSRIVHFK